MPTTQTMTVFTDGTDYTIANDNGQIMDEWIGKDVELFTKGMGRSADHIETRDRFGRTITEYYWFK